MIRLVAIVFMLMVLVLAPGLSSAEEAPLWIDVRSPAEYATGHVEGAPNIPFQLISKHIGAVVERRDTPILLYCATGGRSAVAKRVLDRMGYTNVTDVGGLREVRARLGRP